MAINILDLLFTSIICKWNSDSLFSWFESRLLLLIWSAKGKVTWCGVSSSASCRYFNFVLFFLPFSRQASSTAVVTPVVVVVMALTLTCLSPFFDFGFKVFYFYFWVFFSSTSPWPLRKIALAVAPPSPPRLTGPWQIRLGRGADDRYAKGYIHEYYWFR